MAREYRKWIFWGIQLLIWTFYFVLEVEIIHRYYYLDLRSEGFRIYVRPLLFCFFGLPLTLIIRSVAHNNFHKNKTKPYHWISLLLLSLALSVAWYGFDRLLSYGFGSPGEFANKLVDFFWKTFIDGLILLAWTAVYLFICFWEEWTEERRRTEQALLMAENARLRMLQYQVNPHFFFNMLSSLRGLIRKDPPAATEMVGMVSEYMRYSLQNRPDMMVSLREETEAIRLRNSKTYQE